MLISDNSLDYSNSTRLLTLKIIPKLWLCCYKAWMLYVFEVFFSKSWADLLCFIWVLFKLFSYLPQKLFSLSFFYFNLACKTWWLIDCSILNYFFKSFLSLFLTFFSSSFKSVLLALSFQNQVTISSLSFILFGLVSIVFSLLLYILGCYNKL